MLRGLISMCSLYQLFIETWHFIPEKRHWNVDFDSHTKHFWKNSSHIRITLIPGKILFLYMECKA